MTLLRFKLSLLLVTIGLLANSVLAQESDNIAYRYKTVLKMKDDTSKVVAMVDLAQELAISDKPRANRLHEASIKLARKLRDDIQLTSALVAYGIANLNQGKVDTAAIILKEAYRLSLKTKDELDQANILVNLGNTFYFREMMDSATASIIKGIQLYEKTGNKKRAATATVNLSGVYNKQKLFSLAERSAQKALSISLQLNDIITIGRAYGNLANSYYHRNLDSTIKYYKLGVPYLKMAGSMPHVQMAYNNLSNIYTGKKNYPLAKLYADSNLTLALQIGSPLILTNAYNRLGAVATNLGELSEADKHLKKALEYAKQEGGFLSMVEVYKNLSYLRTEQHRWEEAYDYRILVDEFKDSLNNESNNEQIIEMEEKYQAEKTQAQIARLEKEKRVQKLEIKQRNTLLMGSLGVIILAIFIGFLIYRNSKQKQEIQSAEIVNLKKEKQLEALSGIIKGEENERNRMAQDLHDGLGSLLSGVKLSLTSMKGGAFLSEGNTELFGHSLSQLDGAIQEMRRVAHNLMPSVLMESGLVPALRNFSESLNESGQIHIHFEPINLSQRLGKEQEIVTYRMVQEAVNNAIKHAEATQIIIQIRRVENQVELEVEDNGKGFNLSKISKTKPGGLVNLQHRAEYLNGTLEIRSKAGSGTTVVVSFPV